MAIRLATLRYERSVTGRVRLVRSWHVDTEEEIEAAAESTALGYLATGEIQAGNWDPQDINQGFQVDAYYEGLSAGYADGAERAVWAFRSGFEKEPIEKHPFIGYLIENYGGQEDPESGRVTFARKLTRSNTTQTESLLYAGLYDTQVTQDERPNPLYGLNESGWLSMSGVAVARFVTDDPGQLGGVGEIIDALPGNAPDFDIDPDRNWIKAPPVIDEIPQPDGQRRLYEVELQYLLSPKGGWPEAVYRFIEI